VDVNQCPFIKHKLSKDSNGETVALMRWSFYIESRAYGTLVVLQLDFRSGDYWVKRLVIILKGIVG
jgi:hypothetical protein